MTIFSGYYDVNDYRYVLSHDIKQFYQASIILRLRILDNFYSQISDTTFNNSEFSNRYRPLLAPNVRTEMRRYAKANSNVNALYFWQPFTPQPIAGKIDTRYEITYEGDDWFSITPMGDDTSVRLKVVLAGKTMNPVITEIKNPAFNVNIAHTDSKSLGKGYTLKQEWEYGIFNNCKVNRNYWNYVAGIVYNACNELKADKGYTSEVELLAFADRIEQKREQFLQDFCADLTSPTYSAQAFSQKYDKNITKNVVTSYNESEQPFCSWKMFEPANKQHYTITHIDRDWYGISSTDSLNPDLKVQVVFYEREMRPLIVGLCNDALGIDCQQDFGRRRDARGIGIEIYKQ